MNDNNSIKVIKLWVYPVNILNKRVFLSTYNELPAIKNYSNNYGKKPYSFKAYKKD